MISPIISQDCTAIRKTFFRKRFPIKYIFICPQHQNLLYISLLIWLHRWTAMKSNNENSVQEEYPWKFCGVWRYWFRAERKRLFFFFMAGTWNKFNQWNRICQNFSNWLLIIIRKYFANPLIKKPNIKWNDAKSVTIMAILLR